MGVKWASGISGSRFEGLKKKNERQAGSRLDGAFKTLIEEIGKLLREAWIY
jgi:hypothetical protein